MRSFTFDGSVLQASARVGKRGLHFDLISLRLWHVPFNQLTRLHTRGAAVIVAVATFPRCRAPAAAALEDKVRRRR